MRKDIRIIACILAIISLLTVCIPTKAYAADTVELTIEVTHGQTEARKMVDYINEFRTSKLGPNNAGGAWYWNADDTTKTVFNTNSSNTLGTLVYDYDLERAAQQRAVEIAVQFSHTRPNGESCFTLFPSLNGSGGENLAAGYNASANAYDAFIALREDNANHVGQGHRINMLSPDFNAIGIGHVVMDGVHYWAQALGYRKTPNTTPTTARNDTALVPVEILSSSVTLSGIYAQTSSYTLSEGETKSLPDVVAEYAVTNHFPKGWKVTSYPTVTWTSTHPSVVSVEGDSFRAVASGSAELKAAVAGDPSGKTVSVAVTVAATDISAAQITLEYQEAEYTGKALTPKVTSVTLKGQMLKENTDYTVSYSNNKSVGTATVTVTGKGSYGGKATAKFQIKECSHSYAEGSVTKEATCKETGIRVDKCTKCGSTKNVTIPAKGHTPGAAATCTTPQTCKTCGTVLAAAKGHTPGPAATCVDPQKCTVCGTGLKKATGIHLDLNKDYSCDICGNTAAFRRPGDYNGDGKIDMKDSTVLRRWLAGWSGVTINERNSDVNGDGKVNLLDYTILRRYLAGWEGIELK